MHLLQGRAHSNTASLSKGTTCYKFIGPMAYKQPQQILILKILYIHIGIYFTLGAQESSTNLQNSEAEGPEDS